MNTLIFGAQGSGKSTYGKYLASKLNLTYVSTGDIFRKLAKGKTELARGIREQMLKGELARADLAVEIVNKKLKEAKGFVLDGFPRNLDQAKSLEKEVDLVFYITLPEDIAIQRILKRARKDDTALAIKKRLEIFKTQTEDLLDYYQEKGVRVYTVDNSPPIKVVKKKIDDLLKD